MHGTKSTCRQSWGNSGFQVRRSLLLALALAASTGIAGGAQNWPRFRGPNGGGVAEEARNLPSEFGPATNLAWRIDAPGGRSSPVVWGDRVFITGYEGSRGMVVCFDVASGRKLWEQSIEGTRVERKTAPNDSASSTPVVDEQGVYVLFSGFGLAAFSPDGQERWRQPLGPFTAPHGMGSSPILAGGAVVVVADQVGDSYIAAFEATTGKQRWKTARPNLVGGYATPVLHGAEIVTSGPMEMVAYALETGERRWSMPKVGVMPIASPICVGNRVFAYNDAVPQFEQIAVQMKADKDGDGKISPDEFPDPAFKEAVRAIDRVYGNGDGAIDQAEWDGALKLMRAMNTCIAVDLEGEQPRELWRTSQLLTEAACPLLYDGSLYMVKTGGLLTLMDPASGQIQRRDRVSGLGEKCFASPVAGDGKIYLVNESGKVAVLASGKDWHVLAVNDLAENCYSTPAIVQGIIIVRSEHHLWAFRNAPR